jgi:hypothetical protein
VRGEASGAERRIARIVTPNWTVGFEIELLMPRGHSRLGLAESVARRRGGAVRRFFHPQSEPSKVAGTPSFENLTPAFEALDGAGRSIARFVDDMTLTADLDPKAPPWPGWYRIVTDDRRLLRLIMRQCDAAAPIGQVLAPIAALFGTDADVHPSGMVKVTDDRGVSVAIAAPLPGERERTCEIVTPPLANDQEAALDFLLGEARAAGCTLPREGATHIHFDAAPLASARAIANLVNVLVRHGDVLKRLVGTNPNCIRLGTWPDPLLALVASPGFARLDWPAARQALTGVGLTKYCDFNLLNLANAERAKHTFEVRVLPASLETRPIIAAAELFAALLRWCAEPAGTIRQVPDDPKALIAALSLSPQAQAVWNR